ncbi:patatin-like phospholipase family protein [Nocardioides daejeonensis]|uniref:patatin-like phospholipase family protein n=1 Tax=Nocardioides daejeonensis TaxID=1046556 RepID=UPI00194DC0DA|nr:patatin-like phospholipase family protein [Nocardioides daejeonensis]
MGKRVALALGSGGARGFAHIGVVRALTERDCEIVAISGTSMGALVGGLTAAGRIEEFAEWAVSLRQRDVLRMATAKLTGPGVATADRLLDRLDPILTDVLIEDLPIPFTAVATDLAARREVWFQHGPLRAAVRASIAIPGLFTPVMLNGRLLVDGGLTNPVPIDPMASVPADLTVAVSLTGPRVEDEGKSRESVVPSRESAAPQRFEEWRGRLRRTLAGFTSREEHGDEVLGQDDVEEPSAEGTPTEDAGQTAEPVEVEADEPQEVAPERTSWGTDVLPAELKLLDVTAQAFEAMQGVVGRYRMAAMPADVLITAPVNACRSMDFHHAERMIDLGYRLATDALDEAGVV